MKKAVIFDLDGTLANTLESLAYCTNRALAGLGLPDLPPEAFKRFVGNGARMQIARALRAAGDPEGQARSQEPDDDGFFTSPVHLEEVLARYLDYFAVDCMYQVRPYEGIPELIAALRKRGVLTAVFSNKPHPNTVEVIRALFGLDCFDRVQGQAEGLRKKPAPDGVYEILRQLDLKKEDVLYVGDSCVDMDTGKAAGVYTVGVLWGFREREELIEHGADVLIERPEELLALLDLPEHAEVGGNR